LNLIRSEIDVFFPYKVINVEGAEADDVIAVLAKWSQTNDTSSVLFDEPKPFLVLSGDHDFIQLQKYENVKQFSPIQKKYVKPDISPEKYIFEHIIKGDIGDGVPNILSPDNSFVMNIRQKPVTKKRLEEFANIDKMNAEVQRNYARNKMLIDLSQVPDHLKERILEEYDSENTKDRSQLLGFFMKNRLRLLTESIGEF
jgi:hypothetical protein